MLTLYQAEWCPYSSAVREVLTELGVDFVARQVEPEPEQRESLRALAGTDMIPVLETEDGELFRGTREIFRYLETLEPWEHADAHRQRFLDHADARKSDGMAKIVARFRHDQPGPAVEATRPRPSSSTSPRRAATSCGSATVASGCRLPPP